MNSTRWRVRTSISLTNRFSNSLYAFGKLMHLLEDLQTFERRILQASARQRAVDAVRIIVGLRRIPIFDSAAHASSLAFSMPPVVRRRDTAGVLAPLRAPGPRQAPAAPDAGGQTPRDAQGPSSAETADRLLRAPRTAPSLVGARSQARWRLPCSAERICREQASVGVARAA